MPSLQFLKILCRVVDTTADYNSVAYYCAVQYSVKTLIIGSSVKEFPKISVALEAVQSQNLGDDRCHVVAKQPRKRHLYPYGRFCLIFYMLIDFLSIFQSWMRIWDQSKVQGGPSNPTKQKENYFLSSNRYRKAIEAFSTVRTHLSPLSFIRLLSASVRA